MFLIMQKEYNTFIKIFSLCSLDNPMLPIVPVLHDVNISSLKTKLAGKMSACTENVSSLSAFENESQAENSNSMLLHVNSITDVSSATEIDSPMLSSTPKSSRVKAKFTQKTTKIRTLKSKVYYLEQKLTRGNSNPSDILKNIKGRLPSDIYAFVCSQIKNANVSKYARRWKVEDKNLALKIYLASPRAYIIMLEHFFLPTKKTVIKSISGVNIVHGFCIPVLEAFKKISEKMKKRNKFCVISFDEMSVKRELHFNKKLDVVIGYENYGRQMLPEPYYPW